MIFVIFIE
ncbi:hypothetical protein D050_0647A, partial [Vibrio parahaemolyticus VPCR-2009]